MARTVDRELRDGLLDGVVQYVLSQGIVDLSLRPLARAVGSSPRGLLYHFRSKEDLIVQVLARLRERQRNAFEAMRSGSNLSAGNVCRRAWALMSGPRYISAYRLLFEVYALALRDPKRYASFLRGAIEEWLAFLAEPVLRQGGSQEDAQTFATIMLAGFRGFLMDLCATGARRRIDKAVNVWIAALESVAPHWRNSGGRP